MKRLGLLLALLSLITQPALAATAYISPQGVFSAQISGNPCSGCQLFVYGAGTTTKTNSYTTPSEGAANTNPVILNSQGQAQVWLDNVTNYKLVLAPPTDTDPPTSPYWTTDNIDPFTIAAGSITGSLIAAGTIGTSNIAANAITNALLATAANNTIKSNTSGGTAAPSDNTISSFQGTSSTSFASGADSRFAALPQNSQSAAYTLILSDAGKQIYHPSSDTTARTWTIPANASVAYPLATKIEILNDCSAGALTIPITTDTLEWFPAGTTGTRTLAACGMATLTKVATTKWVIVGSGLS